MSDFPCCAPDGRLTVTLPPPVQAVEWSTYTHMNGEEGGTYPAAECASCDQPIADGDGVHKVGAEWLHQLCAVAAITGATPDLAWLILADQVIARPSAFRASEVKTIMRQVAAIARRVVVDGAA